MTAPYMTALKIILLYLSYPRDIIALGQIVHIIYPHKCTLVSCDYLVSPENSSHEQNLPGSLMSLVHIYSKKETWMFVNFRPAYQSLGG